MTWKLNVRELLHFFDEDPPDGTGHATALVSVMGEELGAALLQDYFKEAREYAGTTILTQHGKPLTPTPGTQRGQRLDRWLCATTSAGGQDLYQVEIKNWSAHAIGGTRLLIDASESERQRIGDHYWSRVWVAETETFRERSVAKVLTRMQLPPGYERHAGKVIPLVCFWWYITKPESRTTEPLFEYELRSNQNGFSKFKIFSVSNYLRSQRSAKRDEIDVEMPQAAQRIAWMKRMFGSSILAA